MPTRFLTSLLIVLACTGLACRKKVDIHSGFYFWGSKFKLTEAERACFSELHAQRLYLHYFDVTKDAFSEKIKPESVINFSADSFPAAEIVPVVFIDNSVFKNSNDTLLATHIVQLVNSISNYCHIEPKEIQMDCDWTGTTKERYFQLLRGVKSLLPEKVFLSATIRLHQVKYSEQTGVPPVDRGMLMYYNMGDMMNDSTGSSILNNSQGEKYLGKLDAYPLPLDVALPIYAWGVQFRNGQPIDLLHRFEKADADTFPQLKKISDRLYEANESFPLHSVVFQKNDLLKLEAVSPADLQKAAALVAGKIKRENRNIIFFDFNEKNISRIPRDEMEAALRSFN